MDIYSQVDAFVYIWTNKADNRKYIGFHAGQPNDGYVASSKPFLCDYRANKSNFSREIVAVGSVEDMYTLETTMLREVDAAKNPNYYNLSNNDGYHKKRPGLKTPEAKSKMVETRRQRGSYKTGSANIFASRHIKQMVRDRMLLQNPMKKQVQRDRMKNRNNNPKARPILVEGLLFPSINAAARHFEMSPHLLKKNYQIQSTTIQTTC